MAFSNMFRFKKKTLVVIISMALSLILLNSVFTFVSGFDMNKYLSKFVISDFVVGHANYFNLNLFTSQNDEPSLEMIKNINDLEGIEDKGRIYYKAIPRIIKDKQSVIQIYGVEDFPLSLLNIIEGELDLNKFQTGNYIIEGVLADDNGNILWDTSNYKIGDKISVTLDNNFVKEYEVMAKAELKFPMSVRYFIGDVEGGGKFYLPSSEFVNNIKNPLTMSYLFNVNDESIDQTEAFLQNYTKNIESQMDYESKETFVDGFKNFQNMFLLVGGLLSLIIGIIGILNFINALITSIISRRMEFAILQSIGMTNRQLNKMLLVEGLYYACITICTALLLGSVISLVIVQPMANNLWFSTYKFTIKPILMASPILILVAIIVPFIAYINVNKQTIVERLREAE